MIWVARCVLEIALLMLVMSLRRASLAIKPAGSSLPLLIRKPVRQACERSLQFAVRLAQPVLSYKRAYVGVNSSHLCITPKDRVKKDVNTRFQGCCRAGPLSAIAKLVGVSSPNPALAFPGSESICRGQLLNNSVST